MFDNFSFRLVFKQKVFLSLVMQRARPDVVKFIRSGQRSSVVVQQIINFKHVFEVVSPYQPLGNMFSELGTEFTANKGRSAKFQIHDFNILSLSRKICAEINRMIRSEIIIKWKSLIK